jgi:hypothetical protein
MRFLLVGMAAGCLMVAGGCACPRYSLHPGEYDFRGFDVSVRGASMTDGGPRFGAEIFSQVSPDVLLGGATSIAFHSNPPFSSFSRHYPWFYSYSRHAVSQRMREVARWLGDDPQATHLLDRIRDLLVEGIKTGEWILDPIVANPEGPLTVRECGPMCRLYMELWSSPVHGDFNELGSGHAMDIAVYYESVIMDHGHLDDLNAEGPYQYDYDVVVIPHVFLFGSRTHTHIYRLGHPWGWKLHHAAVTLFNRLNELYEEDSGE